MQERVATIEQVQEIGRRVLRNAALSFCRLIQPLWKAAQPLGEIYCPAQV